MKKQIILLGIALMSMFSAISQSHIKWKFYSIQTDSLNFEVHLRGELDEGWHIFSQYSHPDGIAIPTAVTIFGSPMFTILDSTSELGRIIIKKDTTLGVVERYFEERVLFVTPLSVKDMKTPLIVKGDIHYQLCDSDRCLPPTTTVFVVILEKNK